MRQPTRSRTAHLDQLLIFQIMNPNNLVFHVYRDTSFQYRWRLIAPNNRIGANSGEGYHNKQDCLHAIDLVASTNGAPVRES